MNRKLLHACVIASLLGVGFWSGAALSQNATVENAMVLSGLVSLSDSHIRTVLGMLEILGQTGEVKSLQWESMRVVLAETQKKCLPCVIWFARPDGSYLTVDKGLIDQSLKDREYFPRVLAGENVVGSLVVSLSTGKKSAVVAVPILKGNKTVGVLGASIYLEAFSELLAQEIGLAENRVFFALDSRGQTVLHCKTERVFADAAAQGSPSLTRAVREMIDKGEGFTEYEYQNSLRRIFFKKSALTGWVYAFGSVRPM